MRTAALLLLLLGCGGQSPELLLPYDPTTIESQIPDVVAALRAGEPIAALEALQRHEPLPGALHYRAIALTDAGRDQEAIQCWEAELAEHPGNGRAHLLLAELLADAGSLEQASSHLTLARQLIPDDALLDLAEGRVALLQARDEEASRHYRDALLADPYGQFAAEAHHALAQIEARRSGPDSPQARQHAALSKQLRDIHEHLAAFQAALARNPDDVDATYGVATAFLSLYPVSGGDSRLLAQAEAALRAALRLRPDDARSLANLGFVASLQQRYDEARALLERAIEADPANGEARLNLARLQRRDGQDEAAEATLRAGLVGHFEADNLARAHLELAELIEASDPEASLDEYRRYLELVPHDPAGVKARIEDLARRTGN